MTKQKDKKPRCPGCSTTQIRFRMNTKTFWCRVCGMEWKKKVAMIIGFLLLTTVANAYSDEQIVNAIYKAEGGAKAQYFYGIRSIECSGDTECRKICSNTVRNNRKRFADYGFKDYPDYISFLASRYCPVGADNDPHGLNKNWEKNVRFYLEK